LWVRLVPEKPATAPVSGPARLQPRAADVCQFRTLCCR
jgi:hypothetical protein